MRFFLALILWPVFCFSQNLTPVVMQLNWYPQADHGGYFTAKAEGIYEKAGLDVTLKPGGPQLNVHQLLAAGQADFIMGTAVRALAARSSGVPIVSVAAWLQIDPVTMMVHEDSGVKRIEDLKGHPIFLPGIARTNYWPWMKARFGLSDEQLKPYDASFRALALDKNAASQGYLTNDDYNFRKLGMKGRSIVLAEHGWPPYASTLDTLEKTIAEKPSVVRAFVKATAEGYRRYLANPASAHKLIKQANPQQEDELMNATHDIMVSAHIVERGGAKAGTMTDARWAETFKLMSESGALPRDFDYRKAYTLQFMKDL